MLTWVEIDKEAIKYNLEQFRKLIGPKTLLMPVIKSNAYGHGFKEIALICNQSREVDKICVVSLNEALDLLKLNIKKPIFILSFYDLDSPELALAIKNDITFSLYTLEQAAILNQIGERFKKKVKVHLKIDTGTSRIGILPQDVISFLLKIKNFSYLYLEGLWSHFASSEDDKEYTFLQTKKLKEVNNLIEKEKIKIPLKHIACTAGAILYPETHLDAVRVGLGIYGLYPSEKTRKKIHLKPALSLYTKIIQIKNIDPGTKVGYGGTWITTKKTKLAIIPLGYFDGFDRKFSNNGKVLIKNKLCSVRGRISMNLTIIDVTKIKNLKTGDQVTIIGVGGREADMLAKEVNTINYEIVTRINPLLPRLCV